MNKEEVIPKRMLAFAFLAMVPLFALGALIPRSSADRTGVAQAADLSPPTTTDTVGQTRPANPSPVTAPVHPRPVIASPRRTPVQTGKRSDRRKLERLHREITWWRTRATKAAQTMGAHLHFARPSRDLAGAKKQKATAVSTYWHYRIITKRREAQLWATLSTTGKYQPRAVSSASLSASPETYTQTKRQVTYWQKKFLQKVQHLRLNAPGAALYAEWYYRLGDGIHPGPLWRCAQGFRPGDGTGEGGLGRPFWNSSRVPDFNPYDRTTPSHGSDAYGWLQMFQSTYERMAQAFLADTPRGIRLQSFLPSYKGHWNDAFYQFMGSGWAFTHGHRSEWMAPACH